MKISELLPTVIKESVNVVPLTDSDFDKIKSIMDSPIPASLATIYLQDVIQDDDLDSIFQSVADKDPIADVRSHVAQWVNRVMPDQMYRFGGDAITPDIKSGIRSPIHGA